MITRPAGRRVLLAPRHSTAERPQTSPPHDLNRMIARRTRSRRRDGGEDLGAERGGLTVMDTATQTLPVARGPYRLYAEAVPGTGVPVVLMHGFPDNIHLYDRLVPHLAGRRPVVRFDFLGWGRSDKPQGYPYTATNQAGDLAAVIDAASKHFDDPEWVLVAHDASGPPAIDWALANPDRVAMLVLLNTYYHWTQRCGARGPLPCTPRQASAPLPAPWSGGGRTWTGGYTPGKSARSSKTPRYASGSCRNCTSSSCPPGRRSGASTTICSARRSAAGGASQRCAASPARSGSSSAPGTTPSTPGSPATSPRCSPTATCTCSTTPGTSSKSTNRSG